MSKPHSSSRACRVEEVQRLRVARGLSVEKLASKAQVDRKTIERLFKGRRLAVESIGRIATALGTTVDNLIVEEDGGAVRVNHSQPSPFHYHLSVAGDVTSGDQAAELGRLALDGVSRLQDLGANIRSHRAALMVGNALPDPKPLEVGTHVLVGVAWTNTSGAKEHTLALVRECDYAAFELAVLDGSLDLRAFEPYGRLFPRAAHDPWKVLDARRPPKFDQDQHDRFFTIVPMPHRWKYLRPSERGLKIHTSSVMFHCNRAAYLGAHHFQHKRPIDLSEISEHTFLHIAMYAWNDNGFQVVGVAMRADRYVDFYKAVRTYAIDLNNFKDFGMVLGDRKLSAKEVWDVIDGVSAEPTLTLGWNVRFYPFATVVLGTSRSNTGTLMRRQE